MTEQDLFDAATIIRSNRKTYSIQITPDAVLVLRVPNRASKRSILKVLKEKQDWIIRNMERISLQKEAAAALPLLTAEELQELALKAKEVLPPKLAFFARQIPVTYGRVTIRNQKTRWGSCSSDGNLNFNCLLMLAPDDVVDYVVVHELCHRKEMNHSAAFWDLVESVLPDYRIPKKWLKEHGAEIMRRAH